MSETATTTAPTVVFTAAAGSAAGLVIRHVCEALVNARISILASRPLVVSGASAEVVDLTDIDLAARLRGADVVIHLGITVDDHDPCQSPEGAAVADFAAVLSACRRSGVARLLVLSSALVLGAQPTNPVPLTEAAVVRPEPALRPAVELGEIERLAGEAAGLADAPVITLLRCAPVVADASPGWLATELHRSLALPTDGNEQALQYLYADDLGSALITVLEASADGVFHVAPDGSLTAAQRRALESRPRLSVSDSAGHLAASVRARLRQSGVPEGIRPYLRHPWLLANDRLHALGWEPTRTSEEAYVEAFRPAPWTMMGSGRRQELLLGAVGLSAAAASAAILTAVRRRRR